MRTLYLPDTPIIDKKLDKLNSKTFIESVHAAILDAGTPYVFGIFGDWGVGKTSALNLLKEKFDEDLAMGSAYNVPIWLNIWKFENEMNIVYPLLFALKKDYELRLPVDDAMRSLGRDLVKVVGSSLIALTDLGLRAITKKLTGEAIKLKDIEYHLDLASEDVGEVEQALDTWASEIVRLPELYETFIANYASQLAKKYGVEPKRIRFAFLIDDLDRCLPDTVIGVLERIKNFLSVPGCVYVLAVNQHVVEQGIRSKFASIELDGREYLEKIVNHAFHVPEPSLDSVKVFALERLNELIPDQADQKLFKSNLEEFGQVLGACGFLTQEK
jgi:KAP family P-loop domain